MYEVKRLNGIVAHILRADGTCIPRALDNRDYREFLEWNAAQPTPLDLSDKPPDPPTPEETRDAIAIAFLKNLPATGDYTTAQLSNGLRAVRRLLRHINTEEI